MRFNYRCRESGGRWHADVLLPRLEVQRLWQVRQDPPGRRREIARGCLQQSEIRGYNIPVQGKLKRRKLS